ncbi:hypothetical protein ACYAXE_004328 [Klebsiella oxytoca]
MTLNLAVGGCEVTPVIKHGGNHLAFIIVKHCYAYNGFLFDVSLSHGNAAREVNAI